MRGMGPMGLFVAFADIARVTLRQLLGRRRTLLLVLLAPLPVLLAVAAPSAYCLIERLAIPASNDESAPSQTSM